MTFRQLLLLYSFSIAYYSIFWVSLENSLCGLGNRFIHANAVTPFALASDFIPPLADYIHGGAVFETTAVYFLIF